MWSGTVGGLVIWMVPFVTSCFLIGPNGDKVIDLDWFRIIMLTVGSLTATYATWKCDPRTLKQGVRLAIQFLVANWMLDLLVLVPLMVGEATQKKLSYETYILTVPYWFRKVGGAYIAMISMCVVAGATAERSAADAINSLKNS